MGFFRYPYGGSDYLLPAENGEECSRERLILYCSPHLRATDISPALITAHELILGIDSSRFAEEIPQVRFQLICFD